MSGSKRPWGVTAGPIIFVCGLVVLLGVRKATSIKATVEDWGQQLEHSAEPVTMELPLYVPLFVGGDWMGRLETVVVQRDRPGVIDSLLLVAHVRDVDDLGRLEHCALRLRVPRGNVGELMRALRCVSNTDGLIAFGNLDVREADLGVPLFVRLEDLPCDDRGHGIHLGPCDRVRDDMRAEMGALVEDLRNSADQFREEAQQIRLRIRREMRNKLRAIR